MKSSSLTGIEDASERLGILTHNLSSADNRGEIRTSSGLFEFDFAQAMSKEMPTVLFSTKSFVTESGEGPVKIVSATSDRDRRRFDVSAILDAHLSHFVFFGYDPRLIAILRRERRGPRPRLVSYTFDTHQTATELMRPLKRTLANQYFELGQRRLRGVDGVITLNGSWTRDLRSRGVPIHVSRIGTNLGPQPNHTPEPRLRCRVLMAGSLEPCNLIGEMFEAFRQLPSEAFELSVFGDGTLAALANDAARTLANVSYNGRVARERLDAEFATADVILCLRAPEHPVTRYSFPSKLVEALALRKTVVTTNFAPGIGLGDVAFVAEPTPRGIAGAIVAASEVSGDRMAKLEAAEVFIEQWHRWPKIAEACATFLRSV